MAEKNSPATAMLEWAMAGLGLLVAATMLAVLGWQAAFGGTDSPPRLSVEAGEIRASPSGFAVNITVRNAGGATAAEAEVEGTLMRGSEDVETSSTTFDYVPGDSSAEGTLLFAQDPRRLKLELRPRGYRQP